MRAGEHGCAALTDDAFTKPTAPNTNYRRSPKQARLRRLLALWGHTLGHTPPPLWVSQRLDAWLTPTAFLPRLLISNMAWSARASRPVRSLASSG